MPSKPQSIAPFLIMQSPSMHYGHGWIMGQDGKHWHPCLSCNKKLSEVSTSKQGKSWLSKMLRRPFR